MADAGISVARLIPNPWLFLEATGQVYRGDSSDVFTAAKPGELSYVGHLRGYQDITESSNIDLGFSYARGHNAAGSGRRRLVRRRSRRSCTASTRRSVGGRCGARSTGRSSAASELIWSRRDQPGGLQAANGFYVSGDYQFARRWFAGVRGDRSDARDRRVADRHRAVVHADVLAERVQPAARPVSADELRARADGERVPVPVPVLDRRARRASVLRGGSGRWVGRSGSRSREGFRPVARRL